jgi:DNA repair exonuclease SbcCD ATPase subunit
MRLVRIAVPLLFGAFLAPALTFSAPSQSANATGGQSASDAPKPTADPAVQTAKKPKKVWTNDEISTAGGPGSISVVGTSAPDANSSAKGNSAKTAPAERSRERQIANYRDRLHQLRNELESTEKKISDLRNFKADNTSSAGGINMNRRYSMTPLEDQVKQLEERKKQLQSQIDALEDQARKSGAEPGDLR